MATNRISRVLTPQNKNLLAAMLSDMTSGLKMNPASEYLMNKPDNLIIVTNAEVESLLYTATGERVLGLQVS